MVQNAYGKTDLPVGTSDSIVNLLNGANQPVLDASDVTMVTDYPCKKASYHVIFSMLIRSRLRRCQRCKFTQGIPKRLVGTRCKDGWPPVDCWRDRLAIPWFHHWPSSSRNCKGWSVLQSYC